MTELPETRYAKTSDGLQIGYQVPGEAKLDLLYFVGSGSQIDLQWSPRLCCVGQSVTRAVFTSIP